MTSSWFYECGACGSTRLELRAEYTGLEKPSTVWRIECGNGHVFVPVPSSEYTIDTQWLIERGKSIEQCVAEQQTEAARAMRKLP